MKKTLTVKHTELPNYLTTQHTLFVLENVLEEIKRLNPNQPKHMWKLLLDDTDFVLDINGEGLVTNVFTY